MPTLEALGDGLLVTTCERGARLGPAFGHSLGVAAYAIAAHAGLWWLTPFLVFLVFVAVVTVTHDVVHGSLSLSRRQTEWALFAMGAVLLESGHAYRATHLRHHRVFPGPDDPEGDPARMGLLKVVTWGRDVFLPRLWLWSLLAQQAGGRREAMAGRGGCLGPRHRDRRRQPRAMDACCARVRPPFWRSSAVGSIRCRPSTCPPPGTTATRQWRRPTP